MACTTFQRYQIRMVNASPTERARLRASARRHVARCKECMKKYARRNKRKQLNIKYRWRGMAKTNTRKHNGRKKYEKRRYD